MSKTATVHHPPRFVLLALFCILSFTLLITTVPAAALLSLGGRASTGAVTATRFSGGVSINGAEAVNDTTATLSDNLRVSVTIAVDPGDEAQPVDIFEVVAFARLGGDVTWFNKTDDGSWSVWDGVGSPAASQSDVTLGSTVELSVFEGAFPLSGFVSIYVGYGLSDGAIIFNPTPVKFSIEEDARIEIDMSGRDSLTAVENQLLLRINGERNAAGLPTLVRDAGLDWIIYWHGTQMAAEHFLSHSDRNGRRAEARARYYSGDDRVRCSEIIQWWGGSPSGDVHYTGYFNSPPTTVATWKRASSTSGQQRTPGSLQCRGPDLQAAPSTAGAEVTPASSSATVR